jgi:ribosomal protein S6
MKLRKYQAILIVDDRKFDDGGDAFMESVGEVITELGGTLDASENLGRRQMAHPIRRRNSATYWELLLTLPAHEVVNLKELILHALQNECNHHSKTWEGNE